MEKQGTSNSNINNPFIKRNKKRKITELQKKKRKSSFGYSKQNKSGALLNRRGTSFAYQTVKPISLTFKNAPQTLDLIKYIKLLKEMSLKKGSNLDKERQKSIMKKHLINKIVDLLKCHKGLYDFFTFYQITEKAILRIARSLHFIQKEKFDYIWYENDFSNKIYFLLKGKVSFKKYVGTEYEREVYQKDENNIFGMDDIVYDRKRKLSCLALEECCCLYFSKDLFKLYMEENVIKVISQRKHFLLRFFNEYLPISPAKIERYISNSVENIFFRKNDIIYSEGDKNTSIYLIFDGEANLMINMNKSSFDILPNISLPIQKIKEKARNIKYGQIIDNCKKEIQQFKGGVNIDKLDLKSYKIIATLSKGSIGGMEISSGITYFKYNLVCNSNFCSIFKINLELFEDEHLKLLMVNLLPNLINKEKKIQKLIHNIKYIDNIVNPPFCQKYKNNKSIPLIVYEENRLSKTIPNILPIKIDQINNINNIKNNDTESSLSPIQNEEKTNNNLIISVKEHESKKTYNKLIKRIDDNFDTNEGGFIKINNFNLNLLKQKNFVKLQLTNNKNLDLKIKNYISKYEKQKKRINLKQSSVKMNYSFKEKNPSDEHTFIIARNYGLGIEGRGKKNKIGNKIKNKFWDFHYVPNFTSKHSDFINFYNNNFNIKKIKGSSARIKMRREMNEMIEKYEKARIIKESSKNINQKEIYEKIISFKEINKRNKSKNFLKKSFNLTQRNFIKELIITKSPSFKKEEANTYTNENLNDIFYDLANKHLKTDINNNKKNSFIKVINNNYLTDLFYNSLQRLNTRKNKGINDIKRSYYNEYFLNKFGNKDKNRMILYNTGQFDMPLATDIQSKEQ